MNLFGMDHFFLCLLLDWTLLFILWLTKWVLQLLPIPQFLYTFIKTRINYANYCHYLFQFNNYSCSYLNSNEVTFLHLISDYHLSLHRRNLCLQFWNEWLYYLHTNPWQHWILIPAHIYCSQNQSILFDKYTCWCLGQIGHVRSRCE